MTKLEVFCRLATEMMRKIKDLFRQISGRFKCYGRMNWYLFYPLPCIQFMYGLCRMELYVGFLFWNARLTYNWPDKLAKYRYEEED